jgi:ADP-ribose pyrophosphatase YjhB (NUDIX family)
VASPPFKDFLKPDYLGVFGLLEEPQGILLVANRRVIGGRPEVVWDLPGGGVEPKETLEEALRREMREETTLDVRVHEMLFVAEGERIRNGSRTGVWRSFFFRIERAGGEIDITGEPDLVDHRFVPRAGIAPLLTAPYHRGFALWLASGGELRHAFDRWID